MSRRPKKERLGWLAAFVVLLIAAGWLMSAGEGEGQRPGQQPVAFPRTMRQQEWERLARRQTLEASKQGGPQPESSEPSLPIPIPVSDPLLRAFSPAPGQSHLVLEANALRHSPLGELLIGCLLDDGAEWVDEVNQELGIDFIEDLDRIGVSGENIFLTGNFSAARFEQIEEAEDLTGRAYGDHGRIYSSPENELSIATWRNELIVLSEGGIGELQATIDRLEGRSAAPPPFPESSSYGELYGVVAVDQLRRMVGGDNDPIIDRLAQIAGGIELHLDAMHDFALRAEVFGEDATALEELSRTLGGALSLARIQAKATGDRQAAEFLSYAGVDRFGGGFAFELALPLEIIRKHLEEVCPSSAQNGPAPSLPAD